MSTLPIFLSQTQDTLNEYIDKAKNYLGKQTNGKGEEYLKTKIGNKKKKYNKA